MSVGKSVNWVGQCIKYKLFFPKVHFVLILQLGCQCIKYELFFSKVHFFLILQLCLAPVFSFFSLSDLKYNLSQISEKIGFFREKSDFFGKMSEFFDFLAKNRLVKSFSGPPKSDFSPKNRPISTIFLSLAESEPSTSLTFLLPTQGLSEENILEQPVI